MNDGATSLFERLPDEGAREELVVQFTPLARHLAQRYDHRGLDRDDLMQVAYVGLLNAIDRYDPDYGSKFVSFAVPTITGELKKHFRDSGWGTGVSRSMKEVRGRSRQASDVLSQKLGRAPTVEEIADYLDVPVDDVSAAAALGTAYRPEALDAPRGSDDNTWISTLGEEDARYELFDDLDAIRPLIEQQSDRDREVLQRRFYDDMTQREIAEEMGISQMHVSRILSSCLEKIRVQISQ